jgi:hypothetical protein
MRLPYSTKVNATRAALREFGPKAKEGRDFTITQGDDRKWTFAPTLSRLEADDRAKQPTRAEIKAAKAKLLEVAATPAPKTTGKGKAAAAPAAPKAEKRAKKTTPKKEPAQPTPKPEKTPRGPTKLDTVVGMLRRPKGATLAEIMAATGWQAHTCRGAIAGAIKTKLRHTVEANTTDGVRVYRIVSEPVEAAPPSGSSKKGGKAAPAKEAAKPARKGRKEAANGASHA